MVFYRPRLERPIMLAQKSGKTNPTTTRATFGAWDVSYTKCVLSSLLSKLTIWINYSDASVKVDFHRCPALIRKISCIWLNCACRLILGKDPTVARCSPEDSSCRTHLRLCRYSWIWTTILTWLERLGCQEILLRSQSVFPCQITSINLNQNWIARRVYQPCA